MYNIEIDIYLDHKRLRSWRCDTHLTTDEVTKDITNILSKVDKKLETSPPKGLSVSYGGPGNYYTYL